MMTLIRLFSIYADLAKLEPGNREYPLKRDSAERNLRQKQQAIALFKRQQKYPTEFVTIESFSWHKGGFDTVMIANFLIKNALPWAVKDIEIRCTHSAASGTVVDHNTRTIYERVEAKKTKRIREFSMGLIHSQASRSGCQVMNVVSLR